MTGGKYPSGPGSIPEKNKEYLEVVQKLLDNVNIKKIVEIGFGDYALASRYNIPEGKKYIGYDVVESLMQENTTYREFRFIKSAHEINETGDLLITKDVIQHWPNKEVKWYLDTLVPRFKYVLLHNGATDGPQTDIKFGGFRLINLNSYEPKQLLLDIPPRRTYILPKYPPETP